MFKVTSLYAEQLDVDEMLPGFPRPTTRVLPSRGFLYMETIGPVTKILASKGVLSVEELDPSLWSAMQKKLRSETEVRSAKLKKIKDLRNQPEKVKPASRRPSKSEQ